MILLYFFTGFILSVIGAAPLGASNIAVITTTTKESFSKGMRIARGAGFGEVLLAFFALCYTTAISDFFEMNSWIQALFILLFFIGGIIFLFSTKLFFQFIKIQKKKNKHSKFLTGLFLAIINPSVLIYWILAISLTQMYLLPISDMSPFTTLTLFFIGVFSGKVAILYFYGKWSRKTVQKEKNTNLYRIIGISLILISTIQGIRFIVS